MAGIFDLPGVNIVGNTLLGRDEDERALQELEQNKKLWESLAIPKMSDYEYYQYQGDWSPEKEALVRLGPSAFEGVATDPVLRAAQLEALQELQSGVRSGGMTAQDRLNVQNIQDQINANNRGNQQAILQNAQMRGLGGSGLELANSLQSQQAGATAASQMGMQAAADASMRKQAQLEALGSLSGQVRGQDFGEAAQRAQARDAISAWNAMNQQGLNTRNTNWRNQSGLRNIDTRQNLSNANTSGLNQWRQDIFNANVTKKQGQTGANTQVAQGYSNKGQQERELTAAAGKYATRGG